MEQNRGGFWRNESARSQCGSGAHPTGQVHERPKISVTSAIETIQKAGGPGTGNRPLPRCDGTRLLPQKGCPGMVRCFGRKGAMGSTGPFLGSGGAGEPKEHGHFLLRFDE